MAIGGFLPPVVVEIIGEVGKFQTALGTAKAGMSDMEAAVAKFQAVGKVATAAVAVGTVAVAAASIKMASQFNQSMELIHTQAGASQVEVEALKNKVLDLAPAVGIGPDKLAQGLYHIESTGYRGQAAMDILAASARLAAMGMADLDTVTYAMSGTMSVGMKDIANAADATAYMNTIVGMGDMTMQKLGAAIGTGVLPAFKSAGLGMRDFGAALATISDNSTPADEAATRLRMTVALMSAPSKAAADSLSKIHLSASQLANDMQKPDGLLVAVMDLKKHLEESGKSAVEQNQIIEHAFGGGKSSAAIMTLLDETDRLKSKYAQLGDAGSRAATMSEAWAQQQKQLSQQMKELGASAQVVGIKIGEFLIPKLQAAAGWLVKHADVAKAAAVVIGGVLVAAMGAFTASVIANTAAVLANPTTWLVALIVAGVAVWIGEMYVGYKVWMWVWNNIGDVAKTVWHALTSAWDATWGAISATWNWAKKNIFEPIGTFLNSAFIQPFRQAFAFVRAIFLGEWTAIRTIVLFAWGFISEIVKAISKVLSDELAPKIKFFSGVWSQEWKIIQGIIKGAYNDVILPIGRAIYNDAIRPVANWVKYLEGQWSISWNSIKQAAQWAYRDVILPVSRYIIDQAINPIREIIKYFESQWTSSWKAASSIVSGVWSVIQPILHAISGAISDVMSAFRDVQKAPAQAGSMFASMLGHIPQFGDGGVVPGAIGQPQIIMAHGGEVVLPYDMVAGGGTASSGLSGPAMAAMVGGSSGGGGYVPIVVNLGPTQMAAFHAQLIPAAQRYKGRTGTTGLT